MAATESGHLASAELDGLYRSHGSDVYRYAFAVLGNHADAEDVTQTTFLNAYRALEQGVRPRKPSNWLLAIASNAIKQRFRQEHSRPRQVELDERTAQAEVDDAEGPTVGELLAALSKIPPQQRQAIVLREFEGRSYAEIAEILGVTTSALETLLFRARRSLAEELEHQLTCTDAQLAVSRATDGRLGRKERRRLRDHLAECPDCARFASVQQRHRRALKGLMLLPVPLSLHFVKGIEGTASAATLPASAIPAATGAIAAGGGTGAVAVTAGAGTSAATGGGAFVGGLALKAAAVVAAATMAGGAVVAGSTEQSGTHGAKTPATDAKPGERVGQVAPRGILVPGNGVARGKADAPGQTKRSGVGNPAPGKASATASAKSRGHAGGATRSAGAHVRKASTKAHATGTPKSPGTASSAKRPVRSAPGSSNPSAARSATRPAKSAATTGPTSGSDSSGQGSGGGPKGP